jgi:glycosyltransferase involved in cell wall biosynthesis
MVIKKCKVENPTVSIICLCYNHEKWLRECLDSLVNQETSFPYEIIIHDDNH